MNFMFNNLFVLCFQDDAISQVRSLSTQLKDIEDERERIDNRHRILQKTLGEAEEGESFEIV